MNVCLLTTLSIAALLIASCSKKPAADGDRKISESTRKVPHEQSEASPAGDPDERSGEEGEEEKPEEVDIAEDCVAFLRATAVGPVGGSSAECPQCPPVGEVREVLKFDDIKFDKFSPSDETCQVAVRIFATFNPSRGGEIRGGLVKWISAEQRQQYARGETPSGQQVYKVNVTYRRNAKGWQPIEFD